MTRVHKFNLEGEATEANVNWRGAQPVYEDGTVHSYEFE